MENHSKFRKRGGTKAALKGKTPQEKKKGGGEPGQGEKCRTELWGKHLLKRAPGIKKRGVKKARIDHGSRELKEDRVGGE